MAHLYGPGGMKNPSAELWHRVWLTYTDPAGKNPSAELWHRVGYLYGPGGIVRRVVAPSFTYTPGGIPSADVIGMNSGSGNEFAAEDEGEFDAVEAAESASAAIQSPFASLERLGVEISAVPAEILSFFQEFDRVAISRHRPQHFWIFDSAEVDFYDYSVPRDGIQFLEAIWKKYGNFISNFRLGNFVGGAMLTLLCCVLMQMRNTSLEDVTETNILEWKGVVQELIQEGFLLGFMIDHLREIARDMFGRRLTAELKTLEARVVAMRNAVTAIVPAHWHLDICHESCW
uniref:Aminotransferase-like plant mobile domain-containing protein n=1 Tax=Fagus sylvatica TaxID=28930 RepID=A0A2N9F3H0_FAGSY